MKKKVIKTAIAAVCVVAAGVSGMKAYNFANQSQAEMLLAENIDALSAGDGFDGFGDFSTVFPLEVEVLINGGPCICYTDVPMYKDGKRYTYHKPYTYDTFRKTEKKSFYDIDSYWAFMGTHPVLETAHDCDDTKIPAGYHK